MQKKRRTNRRLRNVVDPMEFLRRLGMCLECDTPNTPADVVNAPLPSLTGKTVDKFRDQYLIAEVLSKYQNFDLGIDTHRVAVQSFIDQEATNKESNERLLSLPTENFRVINSFELARRKIGQVLGQFDWDLFMDGLRHGPGATTRLSRRESAIPNKLSGKPYSTSSCYNLAYAILTESPSWAFNISNVVSPENLLVIREWDDEECVTKNAKTDRYIRKQPDMNVVIQLAIAYVMRRKFQRWNINLNDQSINQRRAKEGSITGAIATVDWRNASNSLCCSLVYQLIGNNHADYIDPTWYNLMEASRVELGMVDGQLRALEMFSANGNGYTFETESLIFWSLARAVCEVLGIPQDVTIYGDDLTLPSEAVPLLLEVGRYAGLTINLKKTHYESHELTFRESCGKHYVNGYDVSPFYVREELSTVADLILLCNNIKRWARLEYGLDGRLKPLYDWLVSFLPRTALETCIPFGEANDGLIKDFDEAVPEVVHSGPINRRLASDGITWVRVNWSSQRLGYRCKTLKEVSRGCRVDGELGVLTWLYLKSFKRYTPVKDPRDRFQVTSPEAYRRPTMKVSLKTGKRVVNRWEDTGPWITRE